MVPLDEDWQLLLSLLPPGWDNEAVFSGASERLRGFGSTADLLRAGKAVTIKDPLASNAAFTGGIIAFHELCCQVQGA
jgi:hypothetical protein